MMKLDRINQDLLNIIQQDFPLVERPFKKIGKKLKLSEEEVIERLKELKSKEYIRFIGAIINTASLGFNNLLVAFEIDPEEIDKAAEIINSHPGVSHNYKRNDKYNLWFTIATPKNIDIKKTIEILRNLSKAKRYLLLPALKIYKIGVILDVSEKRRKRVLKERVVPLMKKNISVEISPIEKKIIEEIQNSIPLTKEPFRYFSSKLNLSSAEFLEIINNLIKKGIIRRFGAILSHRKLGYVHNIMAVWEVPEQKVDECGKKISSFKAVTHCYKRPIYPDWPYSLYSMIHCRSKDECNLIVNMILKETGIKNYKLLLSEKEYKKKRLKYFSEEFYKWEKKYQ
ncbi:AsnC family transcriptional regulator [Candidatus Aminicenantes bacterium AC-335-A11]|nr:AsnC family transcriptional regulator [SCandidatus Aminicenantes bacterium Aminicenantia_JdfR_composite]MCP2618333.1 AsnC family transcriptional regulator [Candidatus Aminicenantes bacterium AC-335-A11]